MALSVRMVLCAGFLGIVGLGACLAARAPRPTAEPVALGADGGAVEKPLDDERSTGKVVAFKDDAELTAYSEAWREQVRLNQLPYKMPGIVDAGAPVPPPVQAPKAAEPAPPPAAAPTSAPARAVAGHAKAPQGKADAKSESITNNQHADVDEGDIVKLHGDHLVVLRRGRLFTIALEGDRLRQSKVLDAFGPDIDPRGSWYDEMLVEGDHVVVVGFSYARGGTEIGLFDIDRAGQLTYRATYHLRSNDYYSARNYASRIVDGRLVFYAPLYLSANGGDLTSRFPAVRRWSKGAKESDFIRTLPVKQVFHLDGEVPRQGHAALHTVTSCDLRSPSFTCESIGMIGPAGRVFYVSPSNVYVWTQDFAMGANSETGHPNGMLVKMPITRGAAGVTAMRVSGMPTDQFSFEEDDTGHLDVLVRAQSNGDAMFASEKTAGATALLRVPLGLFTDGVPVASPRRYRQLPRPDGYTIQNRFVGSWLLYGSGNGYIGEQRGRGQLYAVRYAASEDPTTIVLEQGVDRIEPMGDDAVVVGSRESDLVFSPIELGKEARARRDYVRKNASQGELRSHGFFYKPGKEPREGIVGLPIRNEGARGASYLLEGSASVLFLRHRSLDLSELGSLAASRLTTNHDGCRASCVDWYGNARPIFAKNRVFALMGYELVEGRIDDSGKTPHLRERMRLSFAPQGGPPASEWE